MRAAVFYGREDVRLEQVDEPRPGSGQVKIRVGFNGICGSDLHEYYAGPIGIPTVPHLLTGAQAPVIMGHEFGGTISEVGDGVDDIAVGDLVAVNPIHTCGQCGPCLSGDTNLCMVAAFHGLMAHGGGLSDQTVVERTMVYPMPEGLNARHAALVEPLAVSYRSVRRAEVETGQQVLIFGGGPIGLGAYLATRWLGAEAILVEPSPTRRTILADLGARVVLDPGTDDVVGAVLDLTNGDGASATIDAAATPSTFVDGMAATARGGNVVIVGIPQEALPFDPIQLFITEITLRASNAYADDFPATIEAMAAGAYPTEGWVQTLSYERLVDDGFEVLRSGKAMKLLVELAGDV